MREKLNGTRFSTYFIEEEKAHDVYKEVFAKGFVFNCPMTIKDSVTTDVLLNGYVYKNANQRAWMTTSQSLLAKDYCIVK